MKRKTKDQIKTVTEAFYDIMKIGSVITIAGLLSQGRNADKLFSGFSKYSVYRIKQMLKRQKLQGYIVYDRADENSPILWTTKGFLRVTKNKLKKYRSLKWDHLWRIISFDIPEKTGARRKFRRLLKSVGCFQFQKSTYVYPHECKKEILALASNLKISKYVTVYVSPNLGNREKEARDFFFNQFRNYKSKK